jgi:hypothetical protein
MGRRPTPNIDPKQVEAAASIGLTLEEIGQLLDCSADTLHRKYKKQVERGWSTMKSSIKRAQYDVGVNKKNPTMLIWLGKQHLGQSDEGGRKQTGLGDQLEGFFKALMAGPAAEPPKDEEAPAAESGEAQTDVTTSEPADGTGGSGGSE